MLQVWARTCERICEGSAVSCRTAVVIWTHCKSDMSFRVMMSCTCRSWQRHATKPCHFLFCGFAGFRILNNSIKQSHSSEADSCIESQENLHLNPGQIWDRFPEFALRVWGNPWKVLSEDSTLLGWYTNPGSPVCVPAGLWWPNKPCCNVCMAIGLWNVHRFHEENPVRKWKMFLLSTFKLGVHLRTFQNVNTLLTENTLWLHYKDQHVYAV
jgi:hypothetical protein